MYIDKDYDAFKCMLECFIFRLRSAHLQASLGSFSEGMNSGIEGFELYKSYWNGIGGNGHARGNPLFQNQTNQWNLKKGTGPELSMAIKQSKSKKDYTDRASYVFWMNGSNSNGVNYSVNIAANWNQDKTDIDGISLYYSWERATKQTDILSFSLQSLALYQVGVITDDLRLCLEFFTEMRDVVELRASVWKNKYKQKEEKLKMKKLLETNKNIILTGAPGTGKTFLARNLAAEIIGCQLKDLQASGQYEFVQFHPSYDYTDFVEGLRPTQQGDTIVFKRKDGIFKAFCKKAAADDNPENKYVFVIDEINRGEISKIFGELFFSIDPGYRGESDKDTGMSNRVKTQYQNLIDEDQTLTDDNTKVEPQKVFYYPFKTGFYVPENVYLIGTMNDIDRSVESMDFAFRRRFAFCEIIATKTQDSILGNLTQQNVIDEAKKRMDALNDAIYSEKNDKDHNLLEGFTSAYHIGAAYFKKIEKYSNDWDKLWENHIKGVLFEYLRGIPNATALLTQLKNVYDLKDADGNSK